MVTFVIGQEFLFYWTLKSITSWTERNVVKGLMLETVSGSQSNR